MKFLIAFLALIAPASAVLGNQVALDSQVFVERSAEQADGSVTVTLEEPTRVVPGDNLLFVLTYQNTGAEAAENFVVTNPMPEAVVFGEAIDSGAVYSVDGGTVFGPLAELRIAEESGVERPAHAADVTHIRWTLTEPIPAGESGQLKFRGIVR
ncbi:DUF11 domain-containing protein [Parasphingopyxis lamellibrachiae]|uniref:Putative repeat protein (TIGR01451 family) n=1 Tax=Parasphingopyxis lamellibrachiae TaxID=680125 RepID=A0A3D9FC00_9SPHN|nr:DUF11 domain-containing protein [Parasphingopyxis lamellibrachiae]RED15344.1 putative repeat protein (TIGR01451 family) [Parasphingopyxis lamellibrachiae]